MADENRRAAPDLDLLEYVLVSTREPGGLARVADAVTELVRAGAIRLHDAVVLVREIDSTRVGSSSPDEHEHGGLSGLTPAVEGRVLLSDHDVELASATLEPAETALLLLVEDSWAGALSDAAREGGARLAAGERITRDRVAAVLAGGPTDLIVRGPATTPVVDTVAQVRELAHLVERGLLPLDRYDVQRRRVVGA